MVIIWSNISIYVYKHTYYLETVLGVFLRNHVLELKKNVFQKQKGVYGNYRVITLIFKKYGNLLLYLENYALFSLPPIFTNNLYTYTLIYIIYLG